MATYYELLHLSNQITAEFSLQTQTFDPTMFLKKIGVLLYTYQDYEKNRPKNAPPHPLAHAFLLASDDGYSIYYDETDPYFQFYITHEIAHYLLKHNKDGDLQENDANMLSMLLLAPPSFFEGKVTEKSVAVITCVPPEIATRYANWLNQNAERLVTPIPNSVKKPRFLHKKYIVIFCLILALVGGSIGTLAIYRHAQASSIVKAPSGVSVTLSPSVSKREVYVTQSSNICHLPTCYYISGKNNLKKMTLKEAIKEGYTPCLVCRPEVKEEK